MYARQYCKTLWVKASSKAQSAYIVFNLWYAYHWWYTRVLQVVSVPPVVHEGTAGGTGGYCRWYTRVLQVVRGLLFMKSTNV